MKRGEKGFTVIELLLVVAITGVIVVPLMMATTTLLTNPQRSTNQNVVLQEVRNAGTWISRDVQMSRTVTPGGSNGFPLSLSIPVDDDENNDNSIEYVFDGDMLKRRLYDPVPTLISETHVADHIDTDNTTFSAVDVGLYRLTVRAARGEAAVTRGYEVSQRLSPAS